MNTRPLYQQIASALCAMKNCRRSGNSEGLARHEANIETVVKKLMPSGSGIDCGTKLLFDESNSERLVFAFSFHHMDDAGYYDGWTEHKAIVRPSLVHGFDLKITGRDRNGIKEYLHEVFSADLSAEIEHTADGYKRAV